MDENDTEWHRNSDAKVWVGKWLETIKEHPDVPNDPGTMVGWFANAIMCGYDCGYRMAKNRAKEQLLKVVSDIDIIW
jgi:hypothetical protein